MATACPNRNSKEWKLLVSQTGETLADLAFVANNYQMPDVKTATEIKKAIGFKSKVDNTAGIANRLKIYNAKNNTSHYFTAKKIWGNTFELTLKYNYLPVNVEKQRQRMAAKQDPLYVTNDFDSKGFQQVYPGTVTPTQATLDFESDDLISPGVPELFESNPELANTVYETLGFSNLKQKNFKNSLWRGQAAKPKIDSGGNLILNPSYEELSQDYGKSFTTQRFMAESYGSRYSTNPYLIEINEDYINNNFNLQDEDVEGEKRIISKQQIKIPKGQFNVVTPSYEEYENKSIDDLIKDYIYSQGLNNSMDEIVFGGETSALQGINYSPTEIILDVVLKKLGTDFDGLLHYIAVKNIQSVPEDTSDYDGDIYDLFYFRDNPGSDLVHKAMSKYDENYVPQKINYKYNNEITPQQKQQAQQLYSQYIDTIFPDSKVKDIVYHGTGAFEKIEKFKGKTYFTNKDIAVTYAAFDREMRIEKASSEGIDEKEVKVGRQVIPAILNLQNPKYLDKVNFRETEKKYPINDGVYSTNTVDPLGGNELQIVVFEPEQIHILGNKQDIEGFKKFVEEDIFDEDYLLPSAPVQLKNVEQKRLNKINKEIVKERHNLNSVTDSKEYLKIIKRLENLRKLVDTAEGRVITSQNVEAFDDVINFGNLQLAEIKNLLNNPAVSYDDVYYAQRVLNLWIKAGDFSTPPEEHLFLDEDEFQTPDIKAEFRALRDVAEDLQEKLTTIKKDYVTNFVRNYTNNTLTKEQIFQHMLDINKIPGSVLNLSRHDDAMLQSIFLAVERANIEAQQETSEVWKDIDSLSEKFLKKAGNNYNILKQLTEDGKETGRLVHRFSSEFFEIRNRLLAQAFKERDKTTGALKKDKKKINAYFDWINTNTISFDPRILFSDSGMEGGVMPEKFYYNRITFTEEQKAKHIAELKYHLGEKGYEFFLKRVEEKIEQFKMRREAIYDSIQLEPALSADEKDALFADWNKENSPFWAMDMAENPAVRVKSKDASGVETYYTPKGMREYIQQVPRKEIGGKATKWYDKNFQKIEADKDLLAYYDFTMSTLKKLRYMLPEQKRAVMGIGVLPTMEKSLMDIFAEKGVMMGVIPFWDKMKELQTTTDFSTVLTSDVDPYTGDIEKNIQLQYIEDSSGKIADMVKVMTVKYQQETGKPATHEDRLRFKKEAKDILSKEKSWDVTKILKAYSLTVLAYKHKSFIEPQIRLAQQAFNDRKELVVNKQGQPQEKDGQLATKEGLVNAKSALDFFLDTTMWNIGGRKVQGVTNKKLYTKKEEKQKKELEALIAKETDEETKKFLQTQLDALGGFRTLSGVGDTILKFQTLKALGWNFISGASNLGFGIISNWIQAADGREYTQAQMRRAYMLSINSIGRNLSFNTFEGINGNAVKIRTLMDKWDLLKTSNKELFDLSNKQSYFKKLKRFSPFSIQERTEYLNQAPIMIAVLLNQKATAPDGSTVTLWDAYDINTGQLREGFETDVDEVKLVQKMKRIIEMNHGDYNNALQAKSTIEGRLLTQFRTWMFEGFANRFESEKVDYALSYGMDEPYLRKGRYRSYSKGQLLTTGATLGTMFLPGIGTALGAGVGYAAGKLGLGLQTDDNVISDTLFTLKQLTRKLLFQKTGFEKKFTAVDAANMRKNMTELYIMVGLIGMGLFLKAMIADDDEEDEEKSNTAVFLLNQTIRLRTDISFYTNPLEFEKLTKMAVPAASLIADVKTFVSDVGILFNEDEEDDVFESGPFKGVPKWYIHGGQLVPFAAQGIKSYKMGQRVLD